MGVKWGYRALATPVNSQAVEGHQMTSPSLDYRLIPLTQGQQAIVDAADYERIARYKWCAQWNNHTKSFYALTNTRSASGKRVLLGMHRAVLGLQSSDGLYADHINHDTLDNRRENLRITTCGGNAKNQHRHRDNSIGLKGVSRNHKRYQSTIMVDGVKVYLGTCDTPEEAHALYCDAANKLHGEFGRTE
jgi:hypothetical protein